jgi:hypothetical protein
MFINEFTTLPVLVLAARYDGTIETGDKLISWVRSSRSPKAQRLYFENEVRLVLHGHDGTEDVYEDWWLVKYADNSFEVYPDDEFWEKFKEKK